jgi:putative thioredoxin
MSMTSANTLYDVSLEDFDQRVLAESRKRPVLLDLWADWCPPCIVISPLLASVADEYEGQIAVAKIEVDDGDNMKIAGRYQVRGFPTVILFQDGEEKGRFSGAKTKSYIEQFIAEHGGV